VPDVHVAAGGLDVAVATQLLDLEVTRLRSARALGSPLLAKLRQFQPAVPNLLVIARSDSETDGLDVAAVVRDLRARADRKDDAFFASRGLVDARGFYERFLRLGGVVIWREDAAVDARALLWVNRSARIALPDRASRAVLDALRNDPRRPSAATT